MKERSFSGISVATVVCYEERAKITRFGRIRRQVTLKRFLGIPR